MFSHLTQVAVTEDRSGMITRPRRPQERNPGCLIYFLEVTTPGGGRGVSAAAAARGREAAPNQRLAHVEVGTKPVSEATRRPPRLKPKISE